jgi:hypothetical protein
MATFNGVLLGEIGEVLSANYCYLGTIKSIHMIIKGKAGLVNLFVVEGNNGKELKEDFSTNGLVGTSFLLQSAKIIIVGDDREQVSQIQTAAQSAFRF